VNLGGCGELDGASCRKYNAEGFYSNSSPDNVMNEEYFGIVNADREPKKAYRRLKSFYEALDTN